MGDFLALELPEQPAAEKPRPELNRVEWWTIFIISLRYHRILLEYELDLLLGDVECPNIWLSLLALLDGILDLREDIVVTQLLCLFYGM